jgi:hypothetical protein
MCPKPELLFAERDRTARVRTGFATHKRLSEKGKMRFSTEGGVLY